MTDIGINGITDATEVARTNAYTTYQVTDSGSGQVVYIKIVNAAGRPPSALEHFAREQAVVAELATHPNLVSVYGNSTTASGEPYIVTEVTSGTTVADRAATPPPMTGPEVLHLGVRTAGALESVHRGGVAHGDLRARNIVLNANREPSVADVGLATLTGTGASASGDPYDLEHVAPELLDGQYATPATDQFALATTLYRLFAGESAFVRPGDTSAVAVIKRIATEPPPDLAAKGVPPAAVEVVNKALSKNPAERYPNMQAFARALQQAEVALGLPMTDLTVMTPATQLPTMWSTAPPVPPPPAPAAAAAAGPPSGPPSAGGPPPSGPPPSGAPTSASAKSRTPLFIGIGVAVVVLVLAAFLLTRGDDKKKVSASSNSTKSSSSSSKRSSSSSSSSSDSTDSSTDFAPTGFQTVDQDFDQGSVEVFVPQDWIDVVKVQLDNGEPRLQVAPDTTAFLDGTFTAPGVQIDVFDPVADGFPTPVDLESVLNTALVATPDADGVPGGPLTEACTEVARGNFPVDLGTTSDGQFVGRFAKLTGCRGAGEIVVFIASPADQSFIIAGFVQAVTPADDAAINTILSSILVFDFP